MGNMYRYLLLIFCLLLVFNVYGQRPQGQRPQIKLTGTVMDGTTKTPMNGANVLIKTVTDSLLVGGVTDAQGKFELNRPMIPQVKIEIKFIGYETISKTHSFREPADLGTLVLNEDTQTLGEVVIEKEVV